MLNIWRRPLPTPFNTIQRKHCDQMNPAPPRSSVRSGIRKEAGWEWEPRTGRFPSLSSASCPDNLMGTDLPRVWGGERRWHRASSGKGMEGREENKKERGEECDSEITEAPKVCFCFWPLYVSPGRRGRQSEAPTSHRAAQGAQNRKHETDRNRYSVNTVYRQQWLIFVVKLLGFWATCPCWPRTKSTWASFPLFLPCLVSFVTGCIFQTTRCTKFKVHMKWWDMMRAY